MEKIKQAQEILKDLGLPESQQNKVSALTFLALCNIHPNDDWSKAKRQSLTLSKGIMDFANDVYTQDYKQNTRESFRKSAINPFLNFQIIDLNPDNPNLSPQSSKTHYAIKELVIDTLKFYNTNNWVTALDNFKKLQFKENIEETALIKRVVISNYKSVEHLDIELGRVNVFIGANGSGKSNILEAIAMIGASKGNDLDIDGLMNRGVRIANPRLTLSSFLGKQTNKEIKVSALFEDKDNSIEVKSVFKSSNIDDLYSEWIDKENISKRNISLAKIFTEIYNKNNDLSDKEIIDKFNSIVNQEKFQTENKYSKILSDFAIFNLSTQTLRGLNTSSRKIPLGINGEGLDVLISNFNNYENSKLLKCKLFFNWLDKIVFDKQDELKLSGYKLGKSNSTLYFHDKFMQKKNNLFSAENANEGILHVIFYLSLFISNKTPDFFAIDNVETALNPYLCRTLIKELVTLSKERGKQVLITTHNPAILDGLNLHDDSQRLFEVFRTDEGMTKVNRIKFKKGVESKPYKLSQMWTEGLIGAIPQGF
ncbi:AAA family ATPase [Polaribacter sp. Asnod1-A03]|uniref:AAA family ATPase n=1 Tax=Polaribacter sp. Asnod1-A03 TaxID=3160581 RepID=UPI0038692E92